MENKIKLTVIHILPLEYYPPACNMIDFLSEKNIDIHVFSCKNQKKLEQYENTKIELKQFDYPKQQDRVLFKVIKYLILNIGALLDLVRRHPDAIFYYEPHSAWPVYWYYRMFKSRAKLFIHHHEYYPPEQYKERGMAFARLNHSYEEKYLYKKAVWISQTNNYRKSLFLTDYPYVDKKKVSLLPNYPPYAWKRIVQKRRCAKGVGQKTPYKCVYIGALSLKNTYIKEFCDWVIALNGQLEFDIFSLNIHKDTEEYLHNLKTSYIRYSPEGIPYHKIPNILIRYDVGLVLYKGHNLNYVYNIPNKLFEYLSCKLDVWFPNELKGAHKLIRTLSQPKVIKLEFQNLNQYDIEQLVSKEGLEYKEDNYFYENGYDKLHNFMRGM